MNQALGLITIPLIARKFGPDDFGLYAFALAIMAYFTLLADYGFDLSATKKIAVNSKDSHKISSIISEVFFTKLTILACLSIVFSPLLMISDAG